VTASAEDDGPSSEPLVVNVFSDRGGIIPQQQFRSSLEKVLEGPTDEDASVRTTDEGIVLPQNVEADVRVEAFPSDTNDYPLPSITVGISDTDPIAERTVFTNTTLTNASDLRSNFTRGQLGRFSFTPSGTGTDIIKIRTSFRNQAAVADGTATVAERIDVQESTDRLEIVDVNTSVQVGDTVSGQVVSASSGNGIGEARVFVTRPDGVTDTLTASADGSFSFTADQSGSYTLQAVRVGFEDSGTVTVNAQTQATFDVATLNAPGSATQGQNITVEAIIENNGDEADTQTVRFRLDADQNGSFTDSADVVLSQSISIAAGGSETVTFDVPVRGLTVSAVAGNYTHGVFTATDDRTAELEVQSGSSVTFDDKTVQNGTTELVVESATLPDAGFVVIHAENGDVIGNSSYLGAGTSTNVTVNLNGSVTSNRTLTAMTHRDTDGDQVYEFPAADGPYFTDAGSPVTDTANITVQENVTAPTGPGVLPGQSDPARDLDGDDLYEDINGDGEFNVIDVSIFLGVFGDIDAGDEQFVDFNGDGQINIIDVAALLEMT